ncbi:MAG: exodeoxyribonuclease VII small subunit [Lachnospiraceae bacterium]|jgi:exodeoxyribonuclease VII small subunit|nr:exodeoxyribonuclease VII small subunit [Lachnospiraceae bacterium]
MAKQKQTMCDPTPTGNQTSDFIPTPSLEEQLEQIHKELERLESENCTLEEAFTAYSKGMTLLKESSALIDRVEKKVLLISEDGTNTTSLESYE